MDFLPLVVRAEHRGGYKVHLVFNDGVEGTIDLGPWLEGPVFEPLRNAESFGRFFLEAGSVAWPNGADFAPEALYEKTKSSAATR